MRKVFLAVLAIVLATGVTGAMQEPPPPPQAPQQTFSGPRIPLKVQVTLSRYLGEKKISSIPYMLGVLSGGKQTSLRMGVQVPVVTTTFGPGPKEGGSVPVAQSSYTYRDVGTNIDCTATDAGSGQYSLAITVSDSSVQLDTAGAGKERPQIRTDVPAFRSFNATFAMLLRDGQTMQYASATDPISGEVMRIDVSLSLAK